MAEQSTQARKAWWEVASALTPLIVGICVTGAGVYFTQVYNFRQLQLNQLSALDKFRNLLVSDNPEDREFAYQSFTALGYESLAIRLIQLKQDSAGRGVALEVATGATGATGPAKQEASAILSKLPPQVYIQIAAESQLSTAQAIRSTIQQQGYAVPGIENIAGKAAPPKNTNVRYFNDGDKAVAEAIVSLLRQAGIMSAYSYRVSGLKARPGSLEIWFSPDIK